MMAFELIPIGTILALLTNEVLKTAVAAKDVLVEKESFEILSKYLFDIKPVLDEIQLRELNDSHAAKQALDSLAKDVKKANDLVGKYKNKTRVYLLLKCRHIVQEVQDATRDIGRSLAALNLASTEVLTDVSEKVNRLRNEMQRVELEASQAQVQIVDKLNHCLMEQKTDQGFANYMLEQIAMTLNIPFEPLEMSKELASLRHEIDEAAEHKGREEDYFLEQVIELLYRADAAKDQEEIRKQYLRRLQTIERTSEDYIQPFQSFICPIKRTDVMVDPVSLCTGTTCEREAIVARFERGDRTDPETGVLLDDLSLRPNHKLRQSIEEWRELNYCLKIRSSKRKFQSGEDSAVEEALSQMQETIKENPINKDWIAIEGLIDTCISILGSSHNKDIKRRVLITLHAVVEGHPGNKERVVEESQGIQYIVPCLGRSNISKSAVEFLFELLHDGSSWNISASKKLSEQSSAILFLVMLLNTESKEKAESILLKLCDDDEENIIHSAKANWFKPLINRLVQGPESSRISMVKALVNMELVDQNLKCLGEEGVIPFLVEMVSRDFESKNLALSALVKLSNCHENKRIIADAGGVSIVLEQMFSSHARTIIIARCSEVLERLASNDDGVKFFVDANGDGLDLENIVARLLAFQQNAHSCHIIQKPSLRTLLSIFKSEAKLVEKAVMSANGVPVILPLLDDQDREIREVAINLLFRFSQHESEGIVEFLLMQRRLEALVGFLEDDSSTSAQMAAAGLLANLPKSETTLTKKLIESDGLRAILNILSWGTMEAKENALVVLFRFTDPTNLESQRMVVELGVYHFLVNLLKCGSVTAKANAAALIGNLSLSTPKLSIMSKPTSCWPFRTAHVPTCKAHRGICTVKSTFCLLEANALPELVRLLHEHVHATAYEAVQALSTLVCEDKSHKGANVLHDANAISPVLEILDWGTSSLKEVALDLLEKVFATRELAELYGSRARLCLLALTTRNIHENGQLERKATRVLTQLDRYSRTSMPLAL